MVLLRLAAGVRDDIIFYVPTNHQVFALTFDDGPDPALTPQVLDVLLKHEAHATFFLIGSRAEKHPVLVERIRDEGHEVGNHMWREERASALSNHEFESSILITEKTLARGGSVRLLRPGSGLVNREKVRIAERHGYRCVLGSVFPLDAQTMFPRFTSLFVRVLLQPGAIVILHEGHPSRKNVIGVLDEVLSDARRRGLSAVSAGGLIDLSGEIR
jgi:peptidoglycan/xylan/chitin deacetylase (PgdA/CDA1 family)